MPLRLMDSVSLPIGNSGFLKDMGLKTEINTVGILDNDQQEKQQLILSTNNTISWLNEAFTRWAVHRASEDTKSIFAKNLQYIKANIEGMPRLYDWQ